MRVGQPRFALAWTRIAVVCAIALIAGSASLFATRDAVTAGPDSAVYVGTAHSVASGNGLNVPIHYYPLGNVSIGTPPPGRAAPRPTPLVIYSPGAPVLLSIGGEPVNAARVEDALFFALTVLVVGLFVLAETRELWLAAAAQVVVGGALVVPLADVGTNAVSLFLTALALASVITFIRRPRPQWLLLGAVAVGLATLERYADGGLIVWGTLALLAMHKRRRDAAAFLALSAAPLVAWFIYEHASGRGSGHALGFHIVGGSFRAGARAIADWVLPPSVPTALALVAAIAVVVAVFEVVRRRPQSTSLLLLLFVVVQIVVLEVAITFVDALVNLDSRELLPGFVAVVMALACAVSRTSAMRLVIGLAVVASVARGGVEIARNMPGDYRESRWTHSAVMAAVRALPPSTIIYSNAPDAIYLLDGRAVSSIPERKDFSTLKRNRRYDAQLAEIRTVLAARGGVVVFVRGLKRSYLPSEQMLVSELSLQRIGETRDGAIYRTSARGA